ncbi:cation diffusion facilitator family transporter [Limisalsivibrio acetivorans]|uniref:cation diffusion facilitator family transporter n=1 Tax=Limisalsivibrio acetivorans TaxID=1304888 RepID=UPI0003B36E4C|nr:cation diffusion facilitator family transporter [Limisalsivibrio acetivorans]
MIGKKTATLISVNTAFLLAVIKLIGGFWTGSVSVLSSAMDSLLDIGSSTINFFAIRKSEQPPDKDHRFGHGKYEPFAAFFQSIIINLSGAYILYQAYKKFTGDEPIKGLNYGIYIMIFSLAATLALVIMLRAVGRREKSPILKAEAIHYEIDLLTGGGVLASLFLVKFTGLVFFDPLISVIIALKTMYSATSLGKTVSKDLLDEALSPEDMDKIIGVLRSYKCVIVGHHNIRTRSSGPEKFVDMHINVSKYLTVDDAHFIADCIEKDISEQLGGADVTIHIEPCIPEEGNERCETVCSDEMHESIEKLRKSRG